MKNTLISIDLGSVADWPSFHSAFANALGFPGFYGCNMDAWIDCMTYLDDPSAGMTTVHAVPGHVVVLQFVGAKEFARRCPEQYAALVECSAFVNWRRIEKGDEPVLALSFRA